MTSTKEEIVETCVGQMQEVSARALAHRSVRNLEGAFAHSNTWTAAPGIAIMRNNLNNLDHRTRLLVDEPLVAWVRIANEDGEERTLVVSRHATVDGVLNMTTRDAPMGRLASLSPGEEAAFGEHVFKVIERCVFAPRYRDGSWDGITAKIEQLEKHPLWDIESLRALLDDDDDPFGFGADTDNALPKRRLPIPSRLKDIAILDRWQDAVFRRDPGDRVILLGPPGTGKTTTLVKRVAFHRNTQTEAGASDIGNTLGGSIDPREWHLFSPTPLLRDFAKEAFSREDVVVGDERMRVWSDHRDRLSKEVLGLLKRGGSGAGLVSNREQGPYPSAKEQTAHLADFEQHDRIGFLDTMRTALEQISLEENVPDAAKTLPANFAASDAALMLALSDAAGPIGTWRRALAEKTNGTIDRRIEALVRNDPALGPRIRDAVQAAMSKPEENTDDTDTENDGVPASDGRLTRDLLNQRIRRAILNRARLGEARTSKADARLLALLPEDMFTQDTLAQLGRTATVLRAALPLTRPVRERLDILKRYRTFGVKRRRGGVDDADLDLLVAAKLRLAGSLLHNRRILASLDDPVWNLLGRIAGSMRNAILVDEVSDFSPLELAGMQALSNPYVSGITMAGDFAQRLTARGLRNEDEAHAMIPGLDIVKIETDYRQSAPLVAFRETLLSPDAASHHPDTDGIAPALLEGDRIEDWAQIEARWIAAQVNAVYEQCTALPSIAVFVPDGEGIEGMARRLDAAFVGTNFRAQACIGDTLGESERIRVFAMERVKGLEFEAAFVTGLDIMENHDPDMARQHLYVGASRPAMFLGLTSGRPLHLLDDVRALCVSAWEW